MALSTSLGADSAAFTGAGSPLQHPRKPTAMGSPNYVPRPLPPQLRDSLSYMGNFSSSTDLFVDLDHVEILLA
ncbi:jg11198 [Pararge aegeria aegeria]|uniref:Jg11198 protein n=1 Tax=Pararge aegeria aegeria TaxID=348720 RepID=A0A8S4RIY8_9NEOP|nr:jg11198 [Pararge aegeria aegeria]